MSNSCASSLRRARRAHLCLDVRAIGEQTQQHLNWHPVYLGLLADLDSGS